MIAIVNYNAGNIRSVQNALERLGYESIITDKPDLLEKADKVIFPGVGHAASAMQYLHENHLVSVLQNLENPFLGICLGLQLMCKYSEESNTEGLNIFDVEVKKFPPLGIVPHMGWNSLQETKGPLFKGIDMASDFYFVHSYMAMPSSQASAMGDYLVPFSAALEKDNFFAVQFHPEKSGKVGEQLLMNFLKL
ncbi:MAG: imidazole glycerol phosphate synthase subunit HisH [Luteibaculaceae bacterium]